MNFMDDRITKLIEETIGKLQLTKNERQKYEKNLVNTIKLWRIDGRLGEDDVPEHTDRLTTEWMMEMDKMMLSQMSDSLTKRMKNYRRKIWGLKNLPVSQYIRMKVDEMVKEGMPLFYTNQDALDRFFNSDSEE